MKLDITYLKALMLLLRKIQNLKLIDRVDNKIIYYLSIKLIKKYNNNKNIFLMIKNKNQKEENNDYLTKQIISYLGNKRKILKNIEEMVIQCL